METQARSSTDDGFTLVEVILAMVITVVVMTALAGVVVGSLTTIAQARQRQSATALATQQLERLRAQPYDKVTLQDPAHPGVTVDYTAAVTGGRQFQPPARLLPATAHEMLIVNEVSGKTTTQQIGKITYSVQTYVTREDVTTSGSQAFNLTVIVKWTSAVSKGQREVVQRSTTFSPSGCLSTSTSPFAAPCQAYFTVRAGEALSGLTVSSATGADQLIANLDGTRSMDATQLQLDLANTSTNLLVEQTATGTASGVTSGARVVKGSTTTTGGQAAGAAVDSDPSSVPNQSVTSSTPVQTSALLSTTGTGGTLAIRPSTSDTGSARAAIAAPSSICTGSFGIPLVTGLSGLERPCASSTLQSAGSAATLTYTDPSGTALQLASFGAGGGPSRAVSAILGTSNAGICTGAATVDCGHASVRRTTGASSFGAQPFTAAPSGFSVSRGLWSATGITESATAEEGTGALAHSFSRTGTVWVWDGAGYEEIDLSDYDTPASGPAQTWLIPETAVTYGGVTLTYEGSLSVERPRVTRTPATRTGVVANDCKAEACTTSVDGSGTVTARVTVVVTDGSGELTRFAISADLGGLTVLSSYKAAANA